MHTLPNKFRIQQLFSTSNSVYQAWTIEQAEKTAIIEDDARLEQLQYTLACNNIQVSMIYRAHKLAIIRHNFRHV